jgi:hypothetical protein
MRFLYRQNPEMMFLGGWMMVVRRQQSLSAAYRLDGRLADRAHIIEISQKQVAALRH